MTHDITKTLFDIEKEAAFLCKPSFYLYCLKSEEWIL
ncbi:hypothetical protein IJ22_03370 [Paenibacillus naphthalenovorans]|uniref:Uncharacterized protein n=1 Tax=Paenibacillus naphthalenovorans TaxID=162209 RepID=A0A0U2VIW8_9BACL|nr:hypothetical protein IJ22_03370 [Paenibacillus naphthalenovorans]SDI24123.1 hypothetical protein SAMN05421868_104182 [Paenibacillus naphthalenovorans]